MAEGAYSPNTLRAQKADGVIFQAFCEARCERYLPADPKTIRAVIDDRVAAGKKPATIKRYVAMIARVHVAAGPLNPCSSEAVRLGLKKWDVKPPLAKTTRIPLAGMTSRNLSRALGRGCERIVSGQCSAWLMTLARRAVLVALGVRDIDFHPDGTGQALIRRGKTDAEGQGRMAYLSRWLMAGEYRMGRYSGG
jgi:hypothetical protein